MNKRLFIVFAIILTLTSACKKNTDTSSAGGIVLLTQVTHTNGSATDITTYKYDDQNRLIETYNNVSATDHKYTYDSSDRVITDSYNSSYAAAIVRSFAYNYVANTVSVSTTGDPTLPVNSTPAVSYLNDNQQPLKLYLGNGGGTYTLYTYDGQNNLTSQTTYLNVTASASPSTKVTYTYDQKKNCFINAKGNIAFILGQSVTNNILNVTAYDLVHPNAVTIYANYFYEYNTDGYPVKLTQAATTVPATGTIMDYYTFTYITK